MKQKRNLKDVTNVKNNFPNTYFTTYKCKTKDNGLRNLTDRI